jgi:hypothetical protein
MSGVDRLALVSKILLDSRFLELKRENERLKLVLFWVDHSMDRLQKRMFEANNDSSGPRCRCQRCTDTKRYKLTILDGYGDDIYYESCKFQPWFEGVLQQHGLSFGDDPRADVHFHAVERGDVRSQWAYGAKLRNAGSTTDAGVLKLRALFETLGAEGELRGMYESESGSG